ncbi:MAG: sporulation membrane protein YtaF [Firmicutes bacterium]|nr:sporulation membrane protein YtaF [Bacillota bacterium]
MSLVSIMMLGMAVSFDGFGVGFAYGIRRVHIPPSSLLIICLSSASSMYLSMYVGSLIAHLFSKQMSAVVGGVMLMGVGFFIVRQSLQSGGRGEKREDCQESRGLAILPSVLQEPARADFDCSGTITGKEAIVLGVALAMDAFGAGFGAAMMGFLALPTSLAVGITKFILISAGLLLGKHYSQTINGEKAAVFAGLVLMVLGISHLLT